MKVGFTPQQRQILETIEKMTPVPGFEKNPKAAEGLAEGLRMMMGGRKEEPLDELFQRKADEVNKRTNKSWIGRFIK